MIGVWWKLTQNKVRLGRRPRGACFALTCSLTLASQEDLLWNFQGALCCKLQELEGWEVLWLHLWYKHGESSQPTSRHIPPSPPIGSPSARRIRDAEPTQTEKKTNWSAPGEPQGAEVRGILILKLLLETQTLHTTSGQSCLCSQWWRVGKTPHRPSQKTRTNFLCLCPWNIISQRVTLINSRSRWHLPRNYGCSHGELPTTQTTIFSELGARPLAASYCKRSLMGKRNNTSMGFVSSPNASMWGMSTTHIQFLFCIPTRTRQFSETITCQGLLYPVLPPNLMYWIYSFLSSIQSERNRTHGLISIYK